MKDHAWHRAGDDENKNENELPEDIFADIAECERFIYELLLPDERKCFCYRNAEQDCWLDCVSDYLDEIKPLGVYYWRIVESPNYMHRFRLRKALQIQTHAYIDRFKLQKAIQTATTKKGGIENLCFINAEDWKKQKEKCYNIEEIEAPYTAKESDALIYTYLTSRSLYIVSDGKMHAPKNCKNLFANTEVKYILLKNFDTHETTDMSSMFQRSRVERVEFSDLDTSKVESMVSMFAGSNIRFADLSKWDMHSVKSMHCMFIDCKKLNCLKLPAFNLEADIKFSLLCCSQFLYLQVPLGYHAHMKEKDAIIPSTATVIEEPYDAYE